MNETKLLTYVVGECDDCGREILFGESFEEDSSRIVCRECYDNNKWARCEDCGDLVPRNGQCEVADGYIICECCQDDNYFYCASCGEWHSNDKMMTVKTRRGHDVYICESCLDGYYFKCKDCGEYHHNDECYYIQNYGDICESCYENGDYHCCEDCGEYFCYDDGSYDDNDDWYCNNCYEEHENNRGILSYHSFGRSRYIARLSPKEISGKRSPILLGVELECDDGNFDSEDFVNWMNDDDLIHFEHDGSLGSNGVELITQPCSLMFHRKDMGWEKILETLKSQDFRSHDTDCCGLHIHIGRKELAPTTIVKMDVFVNRAHEFFSRIARRSVFYSSHYIPNKRVDKGKASRTYDERYTAVNTTNDNTVEIRIFRGSLNLETVLGTIEMTHAMVKFLDGISVAHIYDSDNIRKFVDFVCANYTRYPDCVRMFARLLTSSSGFLYERNKAAEIVAKMDKKDNNETNQGEL